MSRSREIPTRDGKVALRITGSLPQLVAIGPRLPVTYTKSSENKESPVRSSVYDTVSSIPVPPPPHSFLAMGTEERASYHRAANCSLGRK